MIQVGVAHLMTTSRNLFQSAGLKRLKHIARPLISLSNVISRFISAILALSSAVSSTSIKHFSSKLQNSQLPSYFQLFSQIFFISTTTFPFSVLGLYISGQKKLHIYLSSFSRLFRISSCGIMKKISVSRYSSYSQNCLCFSAVASITWEKCKSWLNALLSRK